IREVFRFLEMLQHYHLPAVPFDNINLHSSIQSHNHTDISLWVTYRTTKLSGRSWGFGSNGPHKALPLIKDFDFHNIIERPGRLRYGPIDQH
ncbi:N-acetyltransferase family protein, partial [Penicillium lividum]